MQIKGNKVWRCGTAFISILISFNHFISLSFSVSFLSEKWGVPTNGDRTSKRGLEASGQWSYLAPVQRKNCFWIGRGQPSEPRGLDAAGTPQEPIRKAIDQFPLISQLVSTSPLQSKTQQLSQTDRGLAGFQRFEPPKKWIHIRAETGGTSLTSHHQTICLKYWAQK